MIGKRAPLASFGALATLLCALAASGQTVSGEFTISGVVLDPSRATVPGATVRLLHGADPERTAITGEDGAFRFDRLAAGRYEVEAARKAFGRVSVRVVIRNRPPAPLEIVLPIAEIKETIVADDEAGRVTADPAGNRDAVSLDRRAIRDLPFLDQDVIGGLSRFLDPGAVGSGGVTLIVDGLQGATRRVSAATIQEVRINQNPYSAEYGRPGRGRIEITTKAGTSEYHGAFEFLFRDHHLDARNAFAAQRPPEQRRIYEGTLSGPIGKGKTTSFLLTGNHETENLQAIVFAETPGGLVRKNVATPQGQTEFGARLNRQFGKKNTVSLRYFYAEDFSRNDGVGGFTLPEAASDSTGRENLLYYSQRTVASTRFVSEFLFRFVSEAGRSRSLSPDRRIVVEGAFSGGGAQADRRSTQSRVELSETVFWNRGRHSVKAGIQIPYLNRRGATNRSNFGGTWSFATLADYTAGRPFSFQANQGDPHLVYWQFDLGAFVQDDLRLRPDLSVALGLRYDLQNYLADRNNLAPRLSFAWSPDKKRKTVFRGGAGYFYDKTGEITGDPLRYDGRRLRQLIISNPAYPDPWVAGANAVQAPVSVVRFAGGIRSPYSLQYGLGVERQLAKSTTIALNYSGTRGVKLFRSRDVNAPLPPAFLRPDPSLGRLRQIESSAASKAHSLDITFRGNITRFFNGTVRYVLGSARNNAGGINGLPADSYDLTREWSRADFDERQRFNAMGTVMVGDLFRIGTSLSLASGRPYSLTLGRDLNRDGIAAERPPGVPRNSLQGPGSATLDLRWSREFRLSGKKDEGPAVNVGLNVFNVLNRVNYSGYVGNLSSPFFGRPVAARPARRMQLSLAFEF